MNGIEMGLRELRRHPRSKNPMDICEFVDSVQRVK